MPSIKVVLSNPMKKKLEDRAKSRKVSVSRVVQALVRDGFDESGQVCIACEKKIESC